MERRRCAISSCAMQALRSAVAADGGPSSASAGVLERRHRSIRHDALRPHERQFRARRRAARFARAADLQRRGRHDDAGLARLRPRQGRPQRRLRSRLSAQQPGHRHTCRRRHPGRRQARGHIRGQLPHHGPGERPDPDGQSALGRDARHFPQAVRRPRRHHPDPGSRRRRRAAGTVSSAERDYSGKFEIRAELAQRRDRHIVDRDPVAVGAGDDDIGGGILGGAEQRREIGKLGRRQRHAVVSNSGRVACGNRSV